MAEESDQIVAQYEQDAERWGGNDAHVPLVAPPPAQANPRKRGPNKVICPHGCKQARHRLCCPLRATAVVTRPATPLRVEGEEVAPTLDEPTTTSPASALTLAGIKPYETAVGQGVELARREVDASESALQDVAARIDAETAIINTYEAKIATLRAMIAKGNRAITQAQIKIRSIHRRQTRHYTEEEHQQNLLDHRKNSLLQLERMSVPPPGRYQELVPKNGEFTSGDVLRKVDDIVKERSMKDSEIYAGITNSRNGLDNRFNHHKATINDNTTMLVIYSMDTVAETAAYERIVIDHCRRHYGRVTWEDGRCANKVAGGGGVRPSRDPTEKHYLYFLFHAAARRPGE